MALSGCLLLLIYSRKETRHKAETKFVSNSISKASQAADLGGLDINEC